MKITDLIFKLRNDAQISDFTAAVAADMLKELLDKLMTAESDNETLRAAIPEGCNLVPLDMLKRMSGIYSLDYKEQRDELLAALRRVKLMLIDLELYENTTFKIICSAIEKCNAGFDNHENEQFDDTHAKLNPEKVDHTFTHRFKNAMLEGDK